MNRLTSVFQDGVARFARVWSIVSASSLLATAGWSQTLTWLGTLGGLDSQANGVSADGSVVVGWAHNAARRARAFRWQNGMMQDLGTLPGGDFSWANAVSADGSVVVGFAHNVAGENHAFRWENGVMQYLGRGTAYGVSADGSVVVGSSMGRAARWVAGAIQDLGTLPGGDFGIAYGVSADGSVVAGTAYSAAGELRAFRWTPQTGMQDLGTLGGRFSYAWGVSADGSVVVGWAYNAARRTRAFRWQNGMMQDLGTLGGDYSEAWGVSADGSVVVGWYNVAQQFRAFRWTPNRGMEDLNRTYARLLTDGSLLVVARAISPDGRYIVGMGINAAGTGGHEAFLLDTIPEPASLMALGAGLAGLLGLRRRKR